MPSIALATEGNHAKKTGKAQQICFTPTLSAASTIPATAFCTTFSAKVSEMRWTQVLGTLLPIINDLQKCYSKNLVYQIDGAKVGFSPLLLRLLICQSEVLALFLYLKNRFVSVIFSLEKFQMKGTRKNGEIFYCFHYTFYSNYFWM